MGEAGKELLDDLELLNSLEFFLMLLSLSFSLPLTPLPPATLSLFICIPFQICSTSTINSCILPKPIICCIIHQVYQNLPLNNNS